MNKEYWKGLRMHPFNIIFTTWCLLVRKLKLYLQRWWVKFHELSGEFGWYEGSKGKAAIEHRWFSCLVNESPFERSFVFIEWSIVYNWDFLIYTKASHDSMYSSFVSRLKRVIKSGRNCHIERFIIRIMTWNYVLWLYSFFVLFFGILPNGLVHASSFQL